MFLVCGEALYDLFLSKDRGAGQLEFDARPGGSPFNVAIGLARLGARSALLTGISNDPFGRQLVDVLKSEDVAPDYLVHTGRRTTLSVVAFDRSGVPAYAFYGVGSADCSITKSDLPELPDQVTGLHFGSYSIVVPPAADAFCELADRERDRFISLDPNVRLSVEPDPARWRERIALMVGRATLVKVSLEDIETLYPGTGAIDIARSWAASGPAMVVLTRGAQEITAVRGSDEVSVSPPAVEVVDAVGAGDAFQALLLAELSGTSRPADYLKTLSQDGVAALLHKAARAASFTCSRRGADLPRRRDLEETADD